MIFSIRFREWWKPGNNFISSTIFNAGYFYSALLFTGITGIDEAGFKLADHYQTISQCLMANFWREGEYLFITFIMSDFCRTGYSNVSFASSIKYEFLIFVDSKETVCSGSKRNDVFTANFTWFNSTHRAQGPSLPHLPAHQNLYRNNFPYWKKSSSGYCLYHPPAAKYKHFSFDLYQIQQISPIINFSARYIPPGWPAFSPQLFRILLLNIPEGCFGITVLQKKWY